MRLDFIRGKLRTVNRNLKETRGGEEMSDSIFEVEYHPGEEVVLHFKSPELWWLPDSTRQHLSVARKEMLLALRSMLDRAIERMEESGKTKGRKRTKIEVQ